MNHTEDQKPVPVVVEADAVVAETQPQLGRFGVPGVATWREAFTGILEDVLADGERRAVDLGWSYAAVRQAIADHEACLDAVTVPVDVTPSAQVILAT